MVEELELVLESVDFEASDVSVVFGDVPLEHGIAPAHATVCNGFRIQEVADPLPLGKSYICKSSGEWDGGQRPARRAYRRSVPVSRAPAKLVVRARHVSA